MERECTRDRSVSRQMRPLFTHAPFIDYNHERTVGAMSEFIKKNMHSFIFQISAKEKKSGGKWAVDLDGFFSKVH